MQEERYGCRNHSYSAWHRRHSIERFVGGEDAHVLSMIDLDGALFVECDDGTKEPLALFEVAVDVGQSVKPATVIRKLAQRCRGEMPAYVVLYTLGQEANPADSSALDITKFRKRRVWPDPEKEWEVLSPKQYAEKLKEIREWAVHRLDSVSGIKLAPIQTAMAGSNADIFPSIARLYIPQGAKVLDATFGKGVFWAKLNGSATSLKLTTNDIADGAQHHQDFRKLSFPDETFDVVVLDPPYTYSPKGTIKPSIADCYGLNDSPDISCMKKVWELYRDGIHEAHRVLRTGGILIVKSQDCIQAGKQWWTHVAVMRSKGFICEDLFVLVQNVTPAMDPKWKTQRHARKNHSFFAVLKKQ
jgi:hypothetical protein